MDPDPTRGRSHDSGHVVFNCRTQTEELDMDSNRENQMYLASQFCVESVANGYEVTIVVIATLPLTL